MTLGILEFLCQVHSGACEQRASPSDMPSKEFTLLFYMLFNFNRVGSVSLGALSHQVAIRIDDVVSRSRYIEAEVST